VCSTILCHIEGCTNSTSVIGRHRLTATVSPNICAVRYYSCISCLMACAGLAMSACLVWPSSVSCCWHWICISCIFSFFTCLSASNAIARSLAGSSVQCSAKMKAPEPNLQCIGWLSLKYLRHVALQPILMILFYLGAGSLVLANELWHNCGAAVFPS
jgi:hypothetical protein